MSRVATARARGRRRALRRAEIGRCGDSSARRYARLLNPGGVDACVTVIWKRTGNARALEAEKAGNARILVIRKRAGNTRVLGVDKAGNARALVLSERKSSRNQ